jgi:hypothetical protein
MQSLLNRRLFRGYIGSNFTATQNKTPPRREGRATGSARGLWCAGCKRYFFFAAQGLQAPQPFFAAHGLQDFAGAQDASALGNVAVAVMAAMATEPRTVLMALDARVFAVGFDID